MFKMDILFSPLFYFKKALRPSRFSLRWAMSKDEGTAPRIHVVFFCFGGSFSSLALHTQTPGPVNNTVLTPQDHSSTGDNN